MAVAAADLAQAQNAYAQNLLTLQVNMQRENRTFTAVSNIMKTKHDTVKNSIGNIK